MNMPKPLKGGANRIGFVSVRLAGTDGVSMETRKWSHVLEKIGYECFYMAGQLNRPSERSFLVEEASFEHPLIMQIQKECFGRSKRSSDLTKLISQVKERLKAKLYEFVGCFGIGVLIPENALSIPANIPLGLAITEFIAETGINTIAHHHDFFWERKRFLRNAVWDYLNMAFPPHLPSIQHVVINSSANNQLGLRTGISATIIPNVIDFATQASEIDDYSADLREAIGVGEKDLFVLQPTRVVARKRIELAIELVKRLGQKAKLVISHAWGEEGDDYGRRIREYANLLGVDIVSISDRVGEVRAKNSKGQKIYTIWDVYPHADLVTYPSDYEGFGNAFLEAIHSRKPVVINRYSVYEVDIAPKGFKTIALDGYVTEDAVRQTREVLGNQALRQRMVEHNYNLGQRFYSYEVLEGKLKALMLNFFGL
jgi:glycosyltransferase involved in cell wall biosynthesis